MSAPRLQLRLAQQLKLAPVVRQAIALLQLGRLELKTHIREALETNPVLERDDGTSAAESDRERTDTDTDHEQYDTWDDLPDGFSVDAGPAGGGEFGAEDFATDPSAGSLVQHLLWQLNLSHFSASDEAIAKAIIFALDTDGYLHENSEAIGASVPPDYAAGEDEIEAVRHRIQHFEPVGVASRDLSECLSVQLATLPGNPPQRALALRITGHHLDLLADQDADDIARATDSDPGAVEAASALIRSLDPRPGARFITDDAQYIVPDVYVNSSPEHDLRITLNPDIDPKLRLNGYYTQLAGQARGEDAKYLKARLQEAQWLINGLEMRNNTLLSVTRAIFGRQGDFLDAGEAGIKPLVQREIAQQAGVHESTVSRAVTGKYAHTARGTFELKYFFSSAVPGTGGEDVSATAVKARIRQLVDSEPVNRPLSDQALADALRADGTLIARRTVAKYREQLKISSSTQRKRSQRFTHPAH